MNVNPIILAIELLDDAIFMTPGSDERTEIELANKLLRKVLRCRGVFVGEPEKNRKNRKVGGS